MIKIDLAHTTVHVEPTGDPSKLVLLETMETPGNPSRVEHHYDDGVMPTFDVLEEDVRARSSGGCVSREYSILEPGEYVITGGMRGNTQRRTLHLSIGALESGRMEITIKPGSDRGTWVIGDTLAVYVEGYMRFAVEIEDVVFVENAGKVEFERATAWSRIMDDDTV